MKKVIYWTVLTAISITITSAMTGLTPVDIAHKAVSASK